MNLSVRSVSNYSNTGQPNNKMAFKSAFVKPQTAVDLITLSKSDNPRIMSQIKEVIMGLLEDMIALSEKHKVDFALGLENGERKSIGVFGINKSTGQAIDGSGISIKDPTPAEIVDAVHDLRTQDLSVLPYICTSSNSRKTSIDISEYIELKTPEDVKKLEASLRNLVSKKSGTVINEKTWNRPSITYFETGIFNAHGENNFLIKRHPKD